MMIRRAAIQDLEQIMQIYARAVQYMHASGNPNQWVAGYPSRTLIEEDIARGVSYVVDRDSVIEAVFSYIEGEDPTTGRLGRECGTRMEVMEPCTGWHPPDGSAAWRESAFPGVPSRQKCMAAAVLGLTRIRTTALCSIFCKKTDLCTAE